MVPQKLSQAAALSPGSDLWIFAQPRISAFSRKIDFYLNFQMAKAEQREFPSLSKKLKEIIEQNDLGELLKPIPTPNTILISAQTQLPCTQVVVINEVGNKENYIEAVFDIWKKLGKPSVRVFMPSFLDEADLKNNNFETVSGTFTYVAGDLDLDA